MPFRVASPNVAAGHPSVGWWQRLTALFGHSRARLAAPAAPPAPAPRRWEFRLKNRFSALAAFDEQVQACLAAAGPLRPDDAAVFTLQLIFDELLTNVIKYAHPDAPGDREHEIRVGLGLDPAGFTVEIEDDGIPFDPTTAQPRVVDESVPLEDRPIGGWGLSLVRQSVDSFQYQRLPAGNHLTVRKNSSLAVPTP